MTAGESSHQVPTLQIGGVQITESSPCFVIAEVGQNHQGSVSVCKELIRAAKRCGCAAVKLQKRDNRALYTEQFYGSPYTGSNSFGHTYGDHREALEFNASQLSELKEYAETEGILLFATAFDPHSADVLAALDLPAFKIASGDLRSTPLLEYIAGFGKPILLSTGGATLDDVRRAVEHILPRNSQLALLQCTATYPSLNEELNLCVIRTYQREFPTLIIGYSGHELGIAPSIAAYALGAQIIERHFTLDRSQKGSDHHLSLEPHDMKLFVEQLSELHCARGDGVKRIFDSERSAIHKMGKKIVARRDLQVGEEITLEALTFKSPGDGLAPCECPRVLGRVLKESIAFDQAITMEALL